MKESKIFTWRAAVKSNRRFKKLTRIDTFGAKEINAMIHPADCDDSDEFLVVTTPNDVAYATLTRFGRSFFHTTNREDLANTVNERIDESGDTMAVYDRNLQRVHIWASEIKFSVGGKEI